MHDKHTSDFRYFWNPKDDKSVQEAQEVFDKYIAQGFRAVHKGKLVEAFDTSLKSLFFIPPGDQSLLL
jgi:hypothetical protein